MLNIGLKLKDIGEFKLIDKLAKMSKASLSVIKGIGDDCAVLKYRKHKYQLLATDMLLENVHFKTNFATPQQIGHKVIAVNLSDIAACGGIGKYAVISAGLPASLDIRFITNLYKGMKYTAAKFGVSIVGGDTNNSKKIVISAAILGEVRESNLVLRSGAKCGDIIFMTNGLVHKPKDLTFIPRIKESSFLVSNFKISSMIDISDGLLQDLGHIISSSNVGANLYESLIPYKGGSFKRILSSGEQFELLFTVSKRYSKDLLSKARQSKIRISAIGEITDNKKKIVLIDKFGKAKDVEPKGYRHF